jgi:DNA processing protein
MANKELSSGDLLAYLSYKHQGDWNKIFADLKNKDISYSNDEVRDTLNKISTNFITFLDEEYPKELKHSHQPPFVIYYKGDISLLKDITKNVAISGNRAPSLEAQFTLKELLSDNINKNIVIGGSKGLNELLVNEYHQNNKIICVVPCGLDNTYFTNSYMPHCDLIISEYPNDVPPSQNNMCKRIIIMASIAYKTLILESPKHSSTLLLVDTSLTYGHDVLVVPNCMSKNDQYCNNDLIAQGALAVLTKEMFLDLLDS